MISNKYSYIYGFLFSSLLMVVIGSCAKIGSPYGGPKDEEPPKVVKTAPPNGSTNFIPKKSIAITFDEYIKLEDIFNELILSPPLEDNPVAQVKGNKVVVELPKDAIFDTTTYTISFGNAIRDNNEGNILENYSYVFSLKSYLDSMSVEGRLVNSFDHKPSEERFLVMLYKNLNDSAPLLNRPQYVDRTDANGYFAIDNIEIGKYRLFALRDANANLIFDLADESVAFSDSIIDLTPERFKDDIVIQDSMLLLQMANADSVTIDSLRTDSVFRSQSRYTYFTEMVFFTQEVYKQYMIDYLRPQPEKLFFSFNEPIVDSLSIVPLNYTPVNDRWNLPDISTEKDTIIYWILDTNMIKTDSLQFKVQYPVYDSLDQLILKTDSLFLLTERKRDLGTKKRKGRDQKEEQIEKNEELISYIQLSSNVKNKGTLDLNKSVVISLNTPVETFRSERFAFWKYVDTVEVAERFTVHYDSSSMYKVKISFSPEEQTKYKLEMLDSAITDIYGKTNDTTTISFNTQAEDYYGVLSIHVTNVRDPVIIQLLDQDEKILEQDFIDIDQTIRYPYLKPKEYLLKAIIDKNGNGKWDTGNYLEKKQPERVVYFQNELNVRANWEIEMNWPLDY